MVLNIAEQPTTRSTGKTTVSHVRNKSFVDLSESLEQPTNRSTGKTTVSHIRNKSSVDLSESQGQPTTMSTRKTTFSHVRNKSSVELSTSIFTRSATLIPPEDYLLFTSAEALKWKLLHLQASKGNSTFRVVVKNVTDEQLEAATVELPFKKMMRSWRELDDVIITVMPGLKHEVTSRTLFAEIVSAVARIPGHDNYSVRALGSARFHSPGKRSKEGDEGIRCATRQSIKWPNVMIEVGYSEPLAQLRLDAEWWLLESKGHASMVIVVLVADNPNSIDMETWQLRPNNRPQTRSSPKDMPTATQQIHVDAAGAVTPTGCSLTIPYSSLFDTPNPSSCDIIFSASQLSKFAQHIYTTD